MEIPSNYKWYLNDKPQCIFNETFSFFDSVCQSMWRKKRHFYLANPRHVPPSRGLGFQWSCVVPGGNKDSTWAPARPPPSSVTVLRSNWIDMCDSVCIWTESGSESEFRKCPDCGLSPEKPRPKMSKCRILNESCNPEL